MLPVAATADGDESLPASAASATRDAPDRRRATSRCRWPGACSGPGAGGGNGIGGGTKLGRLGGLRSERMRRDAAAAELAAEWMRAGDGGGSGDGIDGDTVQLRGLGTVPGSLGCPAVLRSDPPAMGRESRCGGTGLTTPHHTTERVLHDVLTTRGRSVIAVSGSSPASPTQSRNCATRRRNIGTRRDVVRACPRRARHDDKRRVVHVSQRHRPRLRHARSTTGPLITSLPPKRRPAFARTSHEHGRVPSGQHEEHPQPLSAARRRARGQTRRMDARRLRGRPGALVPSRREASANGQRLETCTQPPSERSARGLRGGRRRRPCRQRGHLDRVRMDRAWSRAR